MQPKHHFFIRDVEKKNEKFFSVIRSIEAPLPKESPGKILKVYFDKSNKNENYHEVIYKTINGFYLHYRSGGTPNYTMDIYFLPEQETDVKFFINSLTTNKTKTI